VITTGHQPLLLEAVHDVRHGGRVNAESLGDVAHVRARVLGEAEQHLRLGVGESRSRLLPQELRKIVPPSEFSSSRSDEASVVAAASPVFRSLSLSI